MKPIIRDDKSLKRNGKYPIYYLIRSNNQQLKFLAKLDIEKQHWNSEKGSVIVTTPEHNLVEGQLQNFILSFQAFMVESKLLNKMVDRKRVQEFIEQEIEKDTSRVHPDNYWGPPRVQKPE